jgi:hypothetical protein
MMKSGRSSEPRCWVSARFLFVRSETISVAFFYAPDKTKLVVAELTLDKDVPSFVSCNQSVVWPTSNEDPSELCSVGGRKGR